MDHTFFVISGIALAFLLLTFIALIDIAGKDFGGIEKKAAWGFITMIPFIGPVIYFLFGFRKGRAKNANP